MEERADEGERMRISCGYMSRSILAPNEAPDWAEGRRRVNSSSCVSTRSCCSGSSGNFNEAGNNRFFWVGSLLWYRRGSREGDADALIDIITLSYIRTLAERNLVPVSHGKRIRWVSVHLTISLVDQVV